MINEIEKDIYLIKIPLPDNPLKELNSYFIKGALEIGGKNLLIDTGFNRPECENAIFSQLEEIGADLHETDIFITHTHSDHCGLVAQLSKNNTKIYCSRIDGGIINSSVADNYWEDLDVLFLEYGLPEKENKANSDDHPGKQYENDGVVDFTYIDDGDELVVGDYKFKCIHAPGHTPGLMCLYDEKKEILICSDHILGNITPNICIENGDEYPLENYLLSLDKVAHLPVKQLLTGHRTPPESMIDRINEIKNHHQVRLSEILTIMEDKELNAYEAAEKMTWQIKVKNWDEFPEAQKWFATGEAAAHLNHLEHLGKVKKTKKNGVYVFSKI